MGLKTVYWAKYHIKHLKMWRQAVQAIAEAVESLRVDAEVYVVGGAAENNLTVLSDVDVLVCIKERVDEEGLGDLRRKILSKAMDEHKLPWDYPVELHVCTACEHEEVLKYVGKYVKWRT